jgi:quinol monooxygenase YgiN
MIIVSGHIVIDPANTARAEELITALTTATREEPENLAYGFHPTIGEPGRYRLYEEWESQAGIDAHNASDHFAAFMAAGAEVGILEVEVNQFAVADKTRLM